MSQLKAAIAGNMLPELQGALDGAPYDVRECQAVGAEARALFCRLRGAHHRSSCPTRRRWTLNRRTCRASVQAWLACTVLWTLPAGIPNVFTSALNTRLNTRIYLATPAYFTCRIAACSHT